MQPDIMALADACIDSDAATAELAALDDAQLRALAWALKERAYGALHGDLDLARRAHERIAGVAQHARDAAVRGEARALYDWVAGALAQLQGRAAEAIELLDRAAATFSALAQHHHAASTQVPKLAALSMLGRNAEALECGLRVRDLFIAAGDEAAAGKVDVNLGSMLLRQGFAAESAPHYRQAAVRFARAGDRQHSVLADIGLATALTFQFEFDEAERLYERAGRRIEAHGLALLRGVVDSSRGLLEMHRGRYSQALRWLTTALAAFETHGPPLRVAEARRDLADAYLALNLLPEAVALYDRAIEECRAAAVPVDEAWARVQRARALARDGRTAEAARGLAQARALFESQRHPLGTAMVDFAAAAIAMLTDNGSLARPCALRAAAAFDAAAVTSWALEAHLIVAQCDVLARRWPEAGQAFESVLARAAALPDITAKCHTGLGLLQLGRGQRMRARASLQQAVESIEAQRAALPGDEFRMSYGADKELAHLALVRMALEDSDAGAALRLMECMEQARARSFELALRDGDGAAGGAQEQRERLHWLREQWQQALGSGDGARASVLQARVAQQEAAALEAYRRAQSVAPAAAAGPRGAGRVDIQALQAALGPKRAMVSYTRLDDAIAAAVVTQSGVQKFCLTADGLVERIERLRFQIDALRFGARVPTAHGAQMVERTHAHLRTLHAQLWAPIEAALGDVEHAIILPHRELHYVPFCALHDGAVALVQRRALSLAPSAATWLAGRSAVSRPSTVLALGIGGTSLPHVAAEVGAVASRFKGWSRVRLDGEATRAALRDGLVGADVVHLACHGQFRADSPYFSSLQLADGELTLRDAAALPIEAGLVTLSACETGLSRVAPGDELLGLVRGFLIGGARMVLASAWTVEDQATADLMSAFYGELVDGAEPAQALRTAQCALMTGRSHPYFWAAFSLHGRATA
jgi:CHAT domain-containing protein/tetratricopeptide (TPR) repeat protein